MFSVSYDQKLLSRSLSHIRAGRLNPWLVGNMLPASQCYVARWYIRIEKVVNSFPGKNAEGTFKTYGLFVYEDIRY